jgi:hypothetical protein
MSGNISAGSTLVVRANAARDVGGFDEDLIRHEEVDFVLRLLRTGKLGYVDEELVTIHESADPTALEVKKSKEILLEKFGAEIAEFESQGDNITARHDFHLARCFFDEGEFKRGVSYLSSGRPSNPRQVIRLCVAIINGCRIKVSGSTR